MSQAIAISPHPPPPTLRRAHLPCINTLRGLAALAVALQHTNTLAWRPQAHFWDGNASHFFSTQPPASVLSHLLFGFGFLGVPLFFVISGFCIHLPYAASDQPLPLRAFATRRFFRLYPPYFILVLTCFALLAVKFGPGNAGVTLPNFLGHLFFWHYFVPPSDIGMGISPVLWTITLEVHFYILYALTLPLLRRIGIGRAAAIAFSLGIVYRFLWLQCDLASLDLPRILAPARFAPARFGEWLLGAAIAQAYASRSLCHLPKPLANPFLGPLVILISLFIAIYAGFERTTLDIPATLGFALLLAARLSPGSAASLPQPLTSGPTEKPHSSSFLQWLGLRSYTLYLWHYTIIASAIEAYARLRRIPDKNAIAGTPDLLLATTLGLLLAFPLAALLYHFIEAPTHRLARHLASTPKTKAPSTDGASA